MVKEGSGKEKIISTKRGAELKESISLANFCKDEILTIKSFRTQHVVICSDSQATQKAIIWSCIIKSYMVWECVKNLNRVGKRKKLSLSGFRGGQVLKEIN